MPVEKKYKSEVYKSIEGRHILHNLYRKHMATVQAPMTERMVDTRFGNTHIVIYGHPEGKPVLAFCGGDAINPLAIRPFIQGLDLNRIQLIVPDPVGHVGFSAERRLSSSKNEYGEWACEVMDGLGLSETAVLGYSFGADIALQLCATSLLRIERLLLVLPSGFVSIPASKTAVLVQPALKDGVDVSDELVNKALNPILPFRQEELTEAVRMLALHAKMGITKVKKIKKERLLKLNAPVYIMAEQADCLFPGEKVIKEARKIFSHIEGVRLLHLGSHCGLYQPTDEERLECYTAMSDFILRND
jgi:pimeloyl-ACP methyl ester carboxylesterase